MEKKKLIFKLKLQRKEVEAFLIRMLQLDGLIGNAEEPYFNEMTTTHKGDFLMHFLVPLKDVTNKDDE